MCLRYVAEKSVFEIGKDLDNIIPLKYLREMSRFLMCSLRFK